MHLGGDASSQYNVTEFIKMCPHRYVEKPREKGGGGHVSLYTDSDLMTPLRPCMPQGFR